MSSQRKKRVGSNRWVANQNATPLADDLHLLESASIAQQSVPEENIESLNVLPDKSQFETQHPSLPELANRKKLSSSRKNKGRQHVKDSPSESYQEPKDRVVQMTRGDDTLETVQMPLAIKSEREGELGQGSADDMYATVNSSLFSTAMPGYSEDQKLTSKCPEEEIVSICSATEKQNRKKDEDPSVIQSYHKGKEEVLENVRSNEAAKMPSIIETVVHVKTVETMLEGVTKTDIHQTKQLSGQGKEHLADISGFSNSNLTPSPADSQKLTDQSDVREMPDEVPSLFSVTEKENKEGSEDTELLMPWGFLQASYLVSEPHVKSEKAESSIAPEITTKRNSPGEYTEPEGGVERSMESSSKEESFSKMKQNEHLNLSEVRGAQNSEDAVNKRIKQVKPTQIYEIFETDHSAENTATSTGKPEDPAELNESQSELTVKNADDLLTKQELSNHGDEQNEYPTKESNVEALDQINEEYDVHDTKNPQTSDTERFDTALGQVYETEDQGEDEITPSAEQIKHQDKEGIFSEVEECELFLQSLQLKTHTLFDYQSEENSVGIDEQHDDPIGNVKKLGSTHRNTARQYVKSSAAESNHELKDVDNNGNATVEPMLSGLQTTGQEELSHGNEDDIIMSATQDSSLYSASAPGYLSEVENSITTNCPASDLESSIPKSESLQEDHGERITDFNVEVSAKSVEITVKMDNFDILQLEEVSGTHQSDDDVNKVDEEEFKPTLVYEIHETDHSFDSVTHNTSENTDTSTGQPEDQVEVSDMSQSELTVQSTNDLLTKQELSNPDEDTKNPQSSDIERLTTALSQVNETEGPVEDDVKPSVEQTSQQANETLFSQVEQHKPALQSLQSEIPAPLDNEPQDYSVSINEQNETDFSPIGNRRKLGSSRRNKGQRHGKNSVAESYQEYNKEVAENTRGNDAVKITPTSPEIERKTLEELSHGNEDDIIMSATQDSSLYSASAPGFLSELENSITTNCPASDLESSIPKSESLQEDHGERITDFNVEVSAKSVEITVKMDNFDILQLEEVSGTHQSDDDVNKVDEEEFKPTPVYEIHETDHSFDSVTHNTSENTDTSTGQPEDQVEVSGMSQSELTVQSTNDLLTKQELSNPDEDTKNPQSSDIERLTTALSQVNETEGPVEDDVKPSVEQTSQQANETLFSQVEQHKPALQSLQSEIPAPLDNEPQDYSVSINEQNETDFSPIGNRRKLGSSRRNKGQRHGKNSVAESYQEYNKEVAENTRGNDAVKITPTSPEIERKTLEELSHGNEDDIIMSATQDSSLYSASAPGFLSELENSITTNCPASDLESSIPKSESLQEDHGERITDFNVEVSAKSVEITVKMDNFDILQLEEVSGTHQSDDDVNKVDEEEFKPTPVYEIHETDHSFDSVTHNTSENTDTSTGQPEDQVEVSDMSQSELTVQSTNDLLTKQELSNPDEDTKNPQSSDIERLTTALSQVNETEGPVEDDVKPSVEQTSQQANETLFSQVEQHKPALQSLQSEIPAPLDNEPQDYSVSINEQNETDFSPIGNRRKLGSSRRNKGQRHGKNSVAESYQEYNKEVAENTRGNDAVKITPTSPEIERKTLEELSHGNEDDIIMSATQDSSLYSASAPGFLSELENSITTNCPASDLESSIPKSESLQEDHGERITDFNVEVSAKSVEITVKMDNFDILQLEEVSGTHQSDDDVNKVDEEEFKPTPVYEIHETDHSFDSVTHNTSENTDTSTGQPEDQVEVSDMSQSELTVQSTNDLLTKQELSNPDEDTKNPQSSDIERLTTALSQVNETEGPVEDDVKPSVEQTSQQANETLFSQVEQHKPALQSLQSEIPAPLDNEPQDYSVSINEQNETDFSPIGNRRKLGSSRRNKGQRHGKNSVAESYQEYNKEVAENTRGNDAVKITPTSPEIERKTLEELSHGNEDDIIMSATQDSSLYSASAPGFLSELENSITTNCPASDLESSIPKSESLQEDHGERITDFNVEVSAKSVEITVKMDNFDILQLEEVSGTHQSDDDVNKVDEEEFKPTPVYEIHETDHSFDSVTHNTSENTDTSTGQPEDQVEVSDMSQSELTVQSTNDLLTKQELSNPDEDTKNPQSSDIDRLTTALSQVNETEGPVEDDVKPSVEQTSQQANETLFSQVEQHKPALQSLQSEIPAPLDNEPQDYSVSINEQNETDFSPIGNRRKLGSSRRNKGQRHGKNSVAESYQRPFEEVLEIAMSNESLKTTTSLTVEKDIKEIVMESTLETTDKFNAEKINDHVQENTHVDTSQLTSISVHLSSTVDQQVIDHSSSREMPDEELPHVHYLKSTETNQETELLRQWGLLLDDNMNPNGIESSITPEITTDIRCPGERTDHECSVEQTTVLSPKEELSTNAEQNVHFKICEVRGVQHSEEVVNQTRVKEAKRTEVQEMHKTDFKPQDNSLSIKEETHTSFKPISNRKKLGSSRRNTGRQRVLDSTNNEVKEEVEKTDGDEASEAIKMLAEPTKQQTDPYFKPAEEIRQIIKSTEKRGENAEKMHVEGATLSQNIMDYRTGMIADIISRSDEDDLLKSTEEMKEEEKEHLKEPENKAPLTGYDTVKMDAIQSQKASVWKDDSGIQNFSYHDDNVTSHDVTFAVLDQEEAVSTEALYFDKTLVEQEILVQPCNREGEIGVDVQQPGQDDVEEKCEHTTKKEHSSQDMNAEIKHVEMCSATQNKMDTHASVESRTFVEVDAGKSQQHIQEKHNLDSEHLEGKSKQKKRKMGSTRRTQLHRKQEDTEADVRNLDRMEVMEELSFMVARKLSQHEGAQPSLSTVYKKQQETNETGSVHDEEQNLQRRNSDVHTIEYTIENIITGANKDAGEAPSKVRMQKTSEFAGRSRCSINWLLSPNTENSGNTDSGLTASFCETEQSIQNVEQDLDSIKVIQGKALKPQEAPGMDVADLGEVKSVDKGGAGEEQRNAQASIQEPNMNEEAHNASFEMKSEKFNSTNRRRKMGSTRRNLGSRHQGGNLDQKQEVDNEATAEDVGDVLAEGVSVIKEEELRFHKENKTIEPEQSKETVFETVEYHHIDKSQTNPLAHQTVEENPLSLNQEVETEYQLTADYITAKPSTSTKQDIMSESASGGRRRKMGSHRKSRGHHTYEDQTVREDRVTDTEQGREVRSLTDESVIKTNEDSLGLDKVSEEDEIDTKQSSNIGMSRAEESRPVNEKAAKPVTPVQHPHAEFRLDQEGQKKTSLGADVKSTRYNVLMVGDASVGKTSFMKRAQNGKFSLDIPSSVGLDSCMWTVVVDGKPVDLQLWDTAGQERFHSITRQIFHKAHAFLLMYDISSAQSFSAVSYWANCIQEGATENVTVLLLGNKSDVAERRVKTQEGEILAKEYNFEFMECSAASGENVIQSLETAARMLSQKANTKEETTVLHKEFQPKKKSGCC
ncbi:uncharacterized protein rab44 isoform X3 [Mastacembelus armatus]|uniref:uncharacterized protein rab44 isoform X2 n=1 Tax=Mastacembelus armatus TaxID=205130 RepID=UPI000E462417|nr:uncharacterized protein LOC113130077 isoform X2 [Mastacembelus armatus]XP_026162166.1 uncharacterized protein LOC113130077 isoform X3 [Mastacembelus armatus]